MIQKKSNERLPVWAIIFIVLGVLSGIILFFANRSSDFAVFFNTYISGPVRAFLAFLTNPIPFSIAEAFIIFLPIIITILIIYAVKRKSDSLKSILIYSVSILSCVSLIFSLFVFSFGVGYHVPTLYERFEIENNGVTADELRVTAKKLATKTNTLSKFVEYSESGASIMPYTLSDMNKLLNESYAEINQEYDFIQGFKSNIKPVFLSIPMSYTHITGIYSVFTGEANLNVDFPDYTLPYTTAHELAHQRGVSRENEANFIAFLVCINTNDAYIQYSAYFNMLEYVASALYYADREAYAEIYDGFSDEIKGELAAYSKFYDQYRNSKAGDISNAINNAHLMANGVVEGTKSYGLVVDLTVAYFEGKFDEKR